MKNPRKPTREQKVIMDSSGLEPTDYLVVKDTEITLRVISKVNQKIIEIEKSQKGERRR